MIQRRRSLMSYPFLQIRKGGSELIEFFGITARKHR
jgi:hypothetical protein